MMLAQMLENSDVTRRLLRVKQMRAALHVREIRLKQPPCGLRSMR